LLLFHPISRGLTVVNLPYAVDHSRVKQNPLSESRLPRINVRANPDVARALQREITVWGIWVIRHAKKNS
jgi:hypothetical protein